MSLFSLRGLTKRLSALAERRAGRLRRFLLGSSVFAPAVARPLGGGAAPRWARLEFECLEDRLAPSVSLVVTSQPPTSVTAGVGFGLTVKAEDASNSVVTSFNGTVSVSAYYNGFYKVAGVDSVQAVNGVATFSAVTADTAGSQDLSVSSSGLTTIQTQFFTVNAAPANHLVFSGQSNAIANGGFYVVVEGEDPFGNVSSSYAGSVTVALGNNPSAATLGGTLTVSASGGNADFGPLTINKLGSGYTLTASATGVTAGVSSPFNVTDQLVVTTEPPPTITAGSPFGLTVKVEDGANTVNTSFTGSIALANSYSGYPLNGVTTVQATAGVATFSGLSLTAAAYQELIVSSAALPNQYTNEIDVTAGSAMQLLLAPPSGTVLAGSPFGLTVDADDQYGNLATSFTGSVTVALGTSQGASLSGTATQPASAGVATFSGLSIAPAGTGLTLKATSTGLTAGVSNPFNVLDQLVVATEPPSTVTAGSAFGLIVKVEDGLNNTVTSFNGPVSVADGSGSPLALTQYVQASAGIATFTGLTLTTAGSHTLDLTSPGVAAATSTSIAVTPAAATHLDVVDPSGDLVSSAPFQLTVKALDPFGNTDTNFSGAVSLVLGNNPTDATLGGTLTQAAVMGVVTFPGLTLNQVGLGFSIQASGSGVTTGSSDPFNVVDKLVVSTEPPSSVAAGAGFGMTVTAEDGQGNVDTSFQGQVTVISSLALNGTLTVQALAGAATFAGLFSDTAGSYPLDVSSPGFADGVSSAVTVNAGAATQLVLSESTGNVLKGANFNLTINAEDAFGNVDPTFTGNVTLAFATNPTNATLGGTTTMAASAGVAAFNGLSINKLGSGYILQATANGLTAAVSAAFAVTDQLVVTSEPPSSVAAGATFGLTVQAEDGTGALDSSFTGSVSATNGYGYPLDGITTVQVVGGIATFTGLSLTHPGYQDLSIGSAGLPSVTADYIDVSSTATRLVISGPYGNVETNAAFEISIDAEDAAGNYLSNFNGTVTLSLSSNPGGATLGGPITAVISFGSAYLSGLSLNQAGNGYVIQATTPGLSAGLSSSFNVEDELAVTTEPPSSLTAGASFGLTVMAEDALGNVNTSFNGPVTISNNQGGLHGTATVNAVNGVAVFAGLSLTQAGAATLSVSSAGLFGGSTISITVAAGSATHLVVNAPQGNVLANGTFVLDVDAADQFGNIDPTFLGPVTLALGNDPTNAALTGNLNAIGANGVAVFSNVTLNLVGTGYTLNATSPGLTGGMSLPFAVTDQLVVTTQPPATVVAGAGFGLLVKVEDGLGNVATGFSGEAHIEDFSVHGIRTVQVFNGELSYTGLSIDQAGVQYLTISSDDLPSTTTGAITVTAGPAVSLAVSAPTANVVIGSTFSVSVKAEDLFGNTDPTYQGSVTLALASNATGAVLGGTLTTAAVNGVANFSGLTLSKLGVGFIVQAGSGSLFDGASNPFSVVDQLVVTTAPPGSVAAGGTFGAVVKAENAQGQVDTSFSGAVTAADGAGSPMGGPLTVTAVAGVATFAGLVLDTAGSHFLSLGGPGLAGTTSSYVTVTAGPAVNLVVGGNGGNVLAAAGFSPVVYAEDAFGNVAPTFSGKVTLALVGARAGAILGGTLPVQASGGQANFSNLSINHPGIGYTLQASSNGLTTGSSVPFNVTDQLVVAAEPPSSVVAGAAFGLTIKVEDALGNVNTAFTGNVTVSLPNAGGGRGSGGTPGPGGFPFAVSGTLTAPVVKGVAVFAGLKVTHAGSFSLTVNSPGLPGASSSIVTVTAAPANHLAVVAPPGVIPLSGPFALTVHALDPFGNIDPTFSGNVLLALAGGPAGAGLGGNLTAHAAAGVANFTGLSVNKLGTGFTIKATSGSLTAGISTAFSVDDDVVVTAQPPSSITAGVPFALTAKIEDALGHVNTAFTGTVSVGGALGLAGTLTVHAVAGVATFTGLSITTTGLDQLALGGTGLLTGSTNLFTVNAAAPFKLAIKGPNPSALFAVVTPPFSVLAIAEDQYGNTATSFNGSVTLALSTPPTGVPLTGTLTADASGGVASFNNLVIATPGHGYVLEATSTGLTAGDSDPFDLANPLVVTQPPPADITAGSSFGLNVIAEDADGRLDTTFNGLVTIALDNYSDGPNDILAGTLAVAANHGVAIFSGLSLDAAGQYGLEVTANGLAGTESVPFNVVGGLATQLAITTEPPNAASALTGFGFAVSAEDQYGNLDTSFHGSVTASLANNPGGGTLGGAMTVNAVDGVATFTTLTIDKPASSYTLAVGNSALGTATTAPIHIAAPGMATQLVVTTKPPASVAAAAGFGLVVKAETSTGVVDTTFNGSVTLDLSANPGGANLGGTITVTAVKGVATFAGLTLDQPGGGYLLDASAAGLDDATSGAIAVTPGHANHLVVFGPDSNVLTAQPFGLSIDAEDGAGNVDPNFNGTVTLALSGTAGASLSGILMVKAVEGVASFASLKVSKAGTFVVKASGAGLTAGASSSFAVTNDQLTATVPPPATATAATGFNVTVTADNAAGNLDSSFTGNVTATLIDVNGTGAVLGGPATTAAVAGVASFTGLTVNLAGDYGLVFSAPGAGPTSMSSFTVDAAAATTLFIATEPPAATTTGTGFGLVVEARDGQGNVDATFNGPVTLALSTNPGAATLGGTVVLNATAGIADFSGLTLNKPANGYVLQATSTGLSSATTSAVNIANAGVATQLVIATQPPSNLDAGAGFSLIVQAEDPNGVVDTSFSGSITVALANNVVGATLGGTVSLQAFAGVAAFAGLTINEPDSDALTASSTGLASATSNSLLVTAAPASQLQVIGPLSTPVVGVPFGVTINAVDPEGNLDTTYTGPVTLALAANPGGATLGGRKTALAINGVATFAGLTLNQPGSGYALSATSGLLNAGASAPFDVLSGIVVVTTQPAAKVAAGAGLGLVAKVEDGLGHVLTSFTGGVTVTLDAQDGNSGALVGTISVKAVAGVATFSGLNVKVPGLDNIDVGGPNLADAFTNNVTVTAAKATRLIATTEPPAAATVGANFTVVLTAEDPFGNTDPTFTGKVTLGVGNNPAGAVLGGATIVSAVNGVASFNMNISKADTGVTLKATATGLTAATSTAFNVSATGVAAELMVATEPPASINAGAAFSVTVHAVDAFGTVDANYNGNVTLALANADPGETLNGNVTMASSGGTATFTNLSLPQAGSYTISATATGLAPATTTAVTVNGTAATRLAILQSGGDVLSNAPFEVDVVAEDGNGNIDATYNGTAAISLANNAGAATLGGTLTVPIVNGVAPFTDLTLNQPGVGYTLHATSSPTLTASTSAAFNVDSDQLAVTTATPTTVATGGFFGFSVAALNNAGAVDTSFNGSVTVALIDFDGTGASLSGHLTATAVAGVATFPGVAATLPGLYALSLTSPGVIAGVSNEFVAAGAAPAAKAPAVTSATSVTFTIGQACTFTVSTSGYPAAALSETGALPTGVTFVDNGNGTATLNGIPAAGSAPSFSLTILGNTTVTLQKFTLKVGPAPAQTPAITSVNADVFTVGQSAPFTIHTTGLPTAALSITSGKLPTGVTFVDNHNGTATLSGKPAAGSGRTYTFTITASNAPFAVASQTFTLTVNQPPAFTSAAAVAFTTGIPAAFTIATTGFPTATLSETGILPGGVYFVDNGDGTATLIGAPVPGAKGVYILTITASNPDFAALTQTLTLTVN